MKYKWMLALCMCSCVWAQSTLIAPQARQATACSERDNASSQGADCQASSSSHEIRSDDSVAPRPSEVDANRAARSQITTEFDLLVQTSVGKPLSVFGSELFQGVPSTFAPMDRIPVRAEYVIGPGDELLIRAWGSIDLDAKVLVDRNGQIYLPKVGALNVAGLRYEQLDKYLKSAISSQFKDFDFNVTMGQLRSIQIFVLGNVSKPGTFTVSSLSTLVNAIFASGGPSSIGSMRSVQLKRAGKIVADLDLYDLLVFGDKSKDAPLEPGDVIYVPPVGPRVALAGSVNNPAIYELRGETTLEDALRFAGGLDNVAGSRRIVVEGIADREKRYVSESTLDEGLSRMLRDGDVVRIFPVSPRFDNAVMLLGPVAQPGRYAWHEGMRISDLIPSREALIDRSYWNKQNALAPYEQAQSGLAKLVTKAEDFRQNLTEINWNYAVVSRLNPADLKTELLTFNLGLAISDPSSPANLALKPGDEVSVFSQETISVSVEKQDRFVQIDGEVNAPGIYSVKPGQTLRDVIAAAGGLTTDAYLFASDLRRESVRLEQEKKLKQLITRLEDENSASRTANASAVSNADDTAIQKSAFAEQQEYLKKLSQVVPTGRVVLDIKEDGSSINDFPALPMEDRDVIHIPARSGTVEMFGAVNNDNALIYHDNAKVSQYLAKAGGPTRQGDPGRLFVIRADGTVITNKSFSGMRMRNIESMRLMPGDAIVVPNKVSNPAFLRGLVEWSKVFSDFALGVAAARQL